MKGSLLFLLMAIPAFGISQTNFQKGYVVTNTKDTLNGYVDYREGLKTPTSFLFKTELNSAAKTYTLKDCAACHIEDRATYHRFLVNISLGSDDLSKISTVVDTSSKSEMVFLQVLETGPNVILYSFADQIKIRFFILDQEAAVPEELVMQLYYKDGELGKLRSNIRYARQLSILMRKYEKLTPGNERRLTTLRYKEDDLVKVAALINGQQKMKSKFEQSRWFAGLSLDMAKTKFRGQNPLAGRDAVSKMSVSPMFSGGIDLFMNPAIRRLAFRLELALIKSKSEVTSPAGGHSFDQLSAIFTPSILYHIYNADKFKVFLSAGPGVNYSKIKNQILTGDLKKRDEPLELKNFHLTFPINVGVVLNKRIELLAGYTVPSSMTSYVYYSVERQRFRLGLNYLFGKH